MRATGWGVPVGTAHGQRLRLVREHVRVLQAARIGVRRRAGLRCQLRRRHTHLLPATVGPAVESMRGRWHDGVLPEDSRSPERSLRGDVPDGMEDLERPMRPAGN